MKKLTFCLVAVALLLPAAALAQSTANGQLTITADVQSTIALTFKQAGSGVLLVGEDTNAATMNLGSFSATSSTSDTGASVANDGTNLTIASDFVVNVTKTNLDSAAYTLTASVPNPTAPDTSVIKVDDVPIAAGATTINPTEAYADTDHTLKLEVPLAQAAGSITRIVSFTATAN